MHQGSGFFNRLEGGRVRNPAFRPARPQQGGCRAENSGSRTIMEIVENLLISGESGLKMFLSIYIESPSENPVPGCTT